LRLVAPLVLATSIGLTLVAPAAAEPVSTQPFDSLFSASAPRTNPWAVAFGDPAPAPPPGRLRLDLGDTQAPEARRPAPVEYSDAYRVRAKIHKIASFAMLPLFIGNYAAGQKLYNSTGESDSTRSLHVALAGTTGALFAINTITGAWNLLEGRKDPNHRTRRLAHGLLMMAADAGFLATAMLAPEGEGRRGVDSSGRRTHRAVAITSMGIATVGYLIMLLGRD
jgi:hypothetical protein